MRYYTHTDSNERFSLQHSLAEIISLIFQRKISILHLEC